MATTRRPAVAGQFYPDRPEVLRKDLESYLAAEVQTAKASLGRDSEVLANQIADSILRRSAA